MKKIRLTKDVSITPGYSDNYVCRAGEIFDVVDGCMKIIIRDRKNVRGGGYVCFPLNKLSLDSYVDADGNKCLACGKELTWAPNPKHYPYREAGRDESGIIDQENDHVNLGPRGSWGSGMIAGKVQKMRATAKLQQIANHLNPPGFDPKKVLGGTKGVVYDLGYDYWSHTWEFRGVYTLGRPGVIYFANMPCLQNEGWKKHIVDVMNNGDGVCMEDLVI